MYTFVSCHRDVHTRGAIGRQSASTGSRSELQPWPHTVQTFVVAWLEVWLRPGPGATVPHTCVSLFMAGFGDLPFRVEQFLLKALREKSCEKYVEALSAFRCEIEHRKFP